MSYKFFKRTHVRKGYRKELIKVLIKNSLNQLSPTKHYLIMYVLAICSHYSNKIRGSFLII